jgi:hypothetical protein
MNGEIWRDVPSVAGILVSSEGARHAPSRPKLKGFRKRGLAGRRIFRLF